MMRVGLCLILCLLTGREGSAEPPEVWRVVPSPAVGELGLREAFARLEARGREGAIPAGGITLRLAAGRYRQAEPIGLGAAVRATATGPVRVLADPGAEVILDGSLEVPLDSFRKVEDREERARLAAAVVDQIVVQTITDPRIHARLSRTAQLGLRLDGESLSPSRFPNVGSAKLDPQPRVMEVSPPAVPVGKQNYGIRAGHPPFQEEGKSMGWLGTLAEPRGAHVRIGTRREEMAGTWSQWEAAIARDPGRITITGFLEANWLQRTQPLVSADAATESFRLAQVLAYGWAWRKNDKPFFVTGLLCEVDQPGEWAYDPQTRRLFLLPPKALSELEELSVPVSEGAIFLDGAEYVELGGLQFQGYAGGDVVQLRCGRHHLIAGCTIRDSSATGVRISGFDHRMLGCDLIDLHHHLVLAGGSRGPHAIVAGGNLVENCHFYQRDTIDRRVGISISGVGQRFRHNLIHRSLGQSVTVHGNDHLIELNELFNIGYDEGDGGAIYAGGDLTGYGVVYRDNFFHHLMHHPGKVERSAIHLDDLQAGATCDGNIFYKFAGKGIFMNGGAGHTVVGNLFLEGFRGVYNVGHGAKKTYDLQEAISSDPQHPRQRTKENYVGRAEQVFGVRGWERDPWRVRYPVLAEVFRDEGEFGRLWPIRCTIRGNAFYGNTRGDQTIWSRVAPEARAKSTIEGDRTVSPSDFVDYDALDFRANPGSASVSPNRFEEIGLYLDHHRRSMPEKAHYRRAVREAFRDVSSMPGTKEKFDSACVVEDGPQVNAQKIHDSDRD